MSSDIVTIINLPLSNNKIVDYLHSGDACVIPTDTLYGLVARASDRQAVSKIYEIKQREVKPGTLIAANIEQLVQLGFKRRYLKAVEDLWPNPLSVIIPCPELEYLHRGQMSLPIRIPKHKDLLELLELVGPLQTTSANMPGALPAVNIQEAINYFGDKVGLYVDGGDLSGGRPSTIIRIDDDAITVLRKGAYDIDEQGRVNQ